MSVPSGDAYVTAPACPVCAGPMPAGRSRRFCSPACRQTAYRRRQLVPVQTPLPDHRSRREGTVYECPDCECRYLAEQWCPDCSRPCRRLGPGGNCPCCDEVITLAELTDQATGKN
jgi:hypothetical protein